MKGTLVESNDNTIEKRVCPRAEAKSLEAVGDFGGQRFCPRTRENLVELSDENRAEVYCPQLRKPLAKTFEELRDNHRFPSARKELVELCEGLARTDGYHCSFLMSPFERGTTGWAYYLSDAFREALDIKQLPRRATLKIEGEKKTEEWLEWQQGSNFYFRRGYVIYDSKDAYDLEWSLALQTMKARVQVVDASPVIPRQTAAFVKKIEGRELMLASPRHRDVYACLDSGETRFGEVADVVLEKTGTTLSLSVLETMEKKHAAVRIRTEVKPRSSGRVTFQFYKPNGDRTGLEPGK